MVEMRPTLRPPPTTTTTTTTTNEIDIVEMLSKSVHHAQKLKKEQLQKRLRQRRYGADGGNDGREKETLGHSYHEVQSRDLLRVAVKVEDQFLDLTLDSLGLEMLHGDERRRDPPEGQPGMERPGSAGLLQRGAEGSLGRTLARFVGTREEHRVGRRKREIKDHQ